MNPDLPDLSALEPDFAASIRRLIAELGAGGIEMRPYCIIRTPFKQAEMWRQSRSKWQIDRALRQLKGAGAPWLADVLDGVGPQFGKRATGSLPGCSWHQHGLAVDCARIIRRKYSWDIEGYRHYAEAARAMGLTAGFFWKSRDGVHVQAPPVTEKVLHRYTWPRLDALMKERFG